MEWICLRPADSLRTSDQPKCVSATIISEFTVRNDSYNAMNVVTTNSCLLSLTVSQPQHHHRYVVINDERVATAEMIKNTLTVIDCDTIL